jgi:hypothetical protein
MNWPQLEPILNKANPFYILTFQLLEDSLSFVFSIPLEFFKHFSHPFRY